MKTMYNDKNSYSILERNGIKMINAGGKTHPGCCHIDSNHYDKEVGSFWAWWSLMFRKKYPNGKNILVEFAKAQLLCGEKNFEINEYDFVSYHAGMCIEHSSQRGVEDLGSNVSLQEIIENNKLSIIDVLHMDIQHSELEAVKDIIPFLSEKKILNIVVSTHSQFIHIELLNIFTENGYEIVWYTEWNGDDGQIYARPREESK